MRLSGGAIVIAVMAAVLGGCDSGPGQDTAGQPSEEATTTSVAEGTPPVGRFLAVAGEQSLDAGLYEIHFAPLRLERLTQTPRVGAVRACATEVVVAAAQQEVGFSDTLQRLHSGKLVPLEGLGDGKGSSPALTSECRLVYKAVDRSDPALIDRLHLWDPESRTDTVLHSAGELLGLDVGPHGQVSVIEGTRGDPGQPVAASTIVVISADRSVRSIPAPAADLGVLRWGASSRMAIGRNDARSTLFLDPDTGGHTELPGWRPLAWSPDGSELLVVDGSEFKTLGVVQASDTSSVRTLGRFDIGVYDVAWLPPGSTPEQGG
jgi:hypothetical protein